MSLYSYIASHGTESRIPDETVHATSTTFTSTKIKLRNE